MLKKILGMRADATATNGHWSGVVVGLVGHCGPDSLGLTRFATRTLPGATVEKANDEDAVNALADRPAVLLVNRVLDGRFRTDSGVELIGELRDRRETVVTILISNLDDAQQQAEAAGALPGFGKKQLTEDVSARRLRAAAELAVAANRQ